MAIQFGQTIYTTKADAIAAVNTEGFELSPLVRGSDMRTTITVKQGVTDLSIIADTCFFNT